MTTTRTLGITIAADGQRFIDKRHRGVRIGLRVGGITQEQAEQRLQVEMARVAWELDRKMYARPPFADCAARYLAQCRNKRSVEVIRWHVKLLVSHVGQLEARQIHDATLESLVADRLAAGASATTINRSLEVARTILNRAARAYRDDDGRPWLDAVPPLITMLPETPRAPYPITWPDKTGYSPDYRRISADGALCSQYRAAQQQCLRIAMDVGGRRAGGRQKCVRDSAGLPNDGLLQRLLLVANRGLICAWPLLRRCSTRFGSAIR